MLALGAAELIWRTFRTAGFGPTTNPRYTERDPELGWRYVAGVSVRHATEDFDVGIEINANGFRDATPPGQGGAEIVTLGDSLTFGWGVEAGECFADRLEVLLGVTVANLGVSGYGTDQELLLWRRHGPGLAPRVVLVLFCANDLVEAARRRSYGRPKPFFPWSEAEGLGEPELPAEPGWLARSHLYRSLRKQWDAASESPPDLSAARGRVAALLRRLAEEVRAAGAEPVVLVEGQGWLADRLGSGAAPVAVLDVAPALEAAAAEGPTTFAHDTHWTAHGHAAVAAAVGEFLRERGLLP